MQLPLIHLNGTSKQELLDGACECGRLLREALQTMARHNPNARDFYPLGPGFYERARAEHEERCRLVESVAQSFMDLAEGIAEGGHKRTA